MYLVVERKGPAWGWTLYSAYHCPISRSPGEYPSREECLRSAAAARRGGVDVRVVERAGRGDEGADLGAAAPSLSG